jgi:hypothetical protein
VRQGSTTTHLETQRRHLGADSFGERIIALVDDDHDAQALLRRHGGGIEPAEDGADDREGEGGSGGGHPRENILAESG